MRSGGSSRRCACRSTPTRATTAPSSSTRSCCVASESADKLTYTIELRQGVEFNDGTPFNAQAVVASFQRYTTYPGSVRASNFVGVAGATATGPYTVVYHLTQRNADFAGNLLPLSPTAIAREGPSFGADPICVAPFMVDSWTPGVSTTLVKSPYYYKRGAVYLDKIVFRTVADIPTALNALQAGDVQVVQDSQVPPAGEPEPDGDQGSPRGLGRRRVQHRQQERRFEEAIDRSTMTRVAFDGTAVPSCTLIPPADTEWYPQTKVPCTPFDPRRTRNGSWPHPATRSRSPSTSSSPPEARRPCWRAQVIQSDEAAVGFNVVIEPLGSAAYVADIDSGHFEAIFFGPQPSDADPSAYIYSYLDTSGTGNNGGYSNPRLDYVLANASRRPIRRRAQWTTASPSRSWRLTGR